MTSSQSIHSHLHSAQQSQCVISSEAQRARLSNISHLTQLHGPEYCTVFFDNRRSKWKRPVDDDRHVVEHTIEICKGIPQPLGNSITMALAQIDLLVDFAIVLMHHCRLTVLGGGFYPKDGTVDLVTSIAGLVFWLELNGKSRLGELISELSTTVELAHRQVRRWPMENHKRDNLIQLVDDMTQNDRLTLSLGTPLLRMASRLHEMRHGHERSHERSSSLTDLKRATGLLEELVAQKSTGKDEELFRSIDLDIVSLKSELGGTPALPECLDLSLDTLSTPIVMTNLPTFRFRFIHCRSLLEYGRLRVFSTETLPEYRFCAVSYVWKGLGPKCSATFELSRPLVVQGAEEADPISRSVLRSICKAALLERCEMVWLDRLSMIQDSKEDKAWQIQNMDRVYSFCRMCCIVPGGLTRLAGLEEESSWIHRGWTLQEAAAPEYPQVLVYWPWGTTTEMMTSVGQINAKEVESGFSALSPLNHLLLRQGDTLAWPSRVDKDVKVVCNIFGGRAGGSKNVSARALAGSLRCHDLDEDRQIERTTFIWRSSFLRTSSRPVDMIFSIMGLLGVTLDVASFAPHDRHRATIELIRSLSARGDRSNWLGFFLDLPPNPRSTYIPALPQTSIAGMAKIMTPNGPEPITKLLAEDIVWYTPESPLAIIDDQGCIEIEARATPIRQAQDGELSMVEESEHLMRSAPRKWCVDTGSTDLQSHIQDRPTRNYGVALGNRKFPTNGYLTGGAYKIFGDTVVMIIQQNNQGGHYCIGYGLAKTRFVDSDQWLMRKLIIRPCPE